MKKFIERLIESFFLISSTITTLTVLLIVIFLFKEGFSLFQETPIEGKSVIVVNSSNPLNELNAKQIKLLYDKEITLWSSIGGNRDTVRLFTINDLEKYFTQEDVGQNFEFLSQRMDSLIAHTPGIIAVIPAQYLANPPRGKVLKIDNIKISEVVKGREWFPTANPAVQLGVLPLILGTLLVSIIAIIIALPIGLATAIYMAEVADQKTRNFLKPVIELLAGIPSVVYGFFGLIVIVPLIQQVFHLPVGETALAGSIVLAIMALPTIITITEDSIRNTPIAMKEASLALGANRWQTIKKVVLPYSMSGISAAAILGIGRAIGETMAVLMVTGNAAVMPHSLLEPVRTIPATIAAELGEASRGGIHYKALFALGCILFLLTLIINLWIELVSKNNKSEADNG